VEIDLRHRRTTKRVSRGENLVRDGIGSNVDATSRAWGSLPRFVPCPA
jgi:hypothetical protein